MASSVSPVCDIDDEDAFAKCKKKLEHPLTGNFAVLFDATQAQCAFDLDKSGVASWLEDHNPANSKQTLWLNFWADGVQKEIIGAVAEKYDISPRLTSLLCPLRAATNTTTPSSDSVSSSGSSAGGATPETLDKTAHAQTHDVEKAVPNGGQVHPGVQNVGLGMSQLSFGDIVNDMWHFCSIDFGARYIYVGFNLLFSPHGPDNFNGSNKPSGQRIWTSLLIFDDNTVVSVFERPPGGSAFPLTDEYRQSVKVARRNVLNVFKHLSIPHMKDDSQDALMKVRIRSTGHTTAEESASLLFYYLFDDWLTTYALIARRQHPYRDTLESLRKKMLDHADVAEVQKLHEVGRQLTVLKLMYQSYKLIVTQLILRQRSPLAASYRALSRGRSRHRDAHMYPNTAASRVSTEEFVLHDDNSTVKVRLSLSAVVRFERLLDRIGLYALTEIEECLKEKESLVLMVCRRPFWLSPRLISTRILTSLHSKSPKRWRD